MMATESIASNHKSAAKQPDMHKRFPKLQEVASRARVANAHCLKMKSLANERMALELHQESEDRGAKCGNYFLSRYS
jgi:hypothetical protein